MQPRGPLANLVFAAIHERMTEWHVLWKKTGQAYIQSHGASSHHFNIFQLISYYSEILNFQTFSSSFHHPGIWTFWDTDGPSFRFHCRSQVKLTVDMCSLDWCLRCLPGDLPKADAPQQHEDDGDGSCREEVKEEKDVYQNEERILTGKNYVKFCKSESCQSLWCPLQIFKRLHARIIVL